MGYSALLFCPDEKTARTVTQVLSELEFTVEACSEPFAAVKKLMGQHFDAVVVDCDNEQNATLLFKSARNSTSNQTSLAVAVVEGQAGVAKAFRFGANLVLTKPINIEQSKGTLRVARGLLRKGDPAKAAPTAPAAPPPATRATAAKPAPESRPVPPPPAAAIPSPLAPEPSAVTVAKPVPAWPGGAVASATSTAHDDDLLEIDAVQPKHAAPRVARHSAMDLFEGPSAASQRITGPGAASAPAPAREPSEPAGAKQAALGSMSVAAPEKRVESFEPALEVGAAPSFTFGGMTDDEVEPSGGAKKIFIGIAAALIVAAGIYWGVTHMRGSESHAALPQTGSSNGSANGSQTPAGVSKSSPSEKPSANLSLSSQPSTPQTNKIQNIIDETAGETHSGSVTAHKPSSESSDESDPEPEPLLVKGGKLSTRPKTVAETPAPAPSMIGMATPEAAAPPTGLVPATTPSLRPTLSAVNVSQGVSTGLLIKKVAPSYPPNALRMHIEGDVQLSATISKDGNITQIIVLNGNSQLTKAASDAVKQWKYKPYLLNGEPVEIQTQVTVRFKLPQ